MFGRKINTYHLDRLAALFGGSLILVSFLLIIAAPRAGAVTDCSTLPNPSAEAACANAQNPQSSTGGNLACGDQSSNGVDLGDESDGDCAKKTSFNFGQCGKDQVGMECLVDEILGFLTAAVGIAVVGGITAGGIMYSTSRGNPGGAQKGITIITNSVIALVLYFLMYAIINFLIPGGIF